MDPTDTIAAAVNEPSNPALPASEAAVPKDDAPAAPPAADDDKALPALHAATRVGARTVLSGNAWLIGAAIVGAISVVSLTLVLLGQQRLRTLEQELVRRQQDSETHAIEARAAAKQALEAAHAADTRLALLESRVAENALQRTQLEELIQQLSRSRDENALADVDAAIRVAVQQSALTGSTEPLLAALRQAEERLGRISQPRLERVRRAISRDIDRVRAVAVADVASLAIKLDEAVRLVDEMVLLAQPERRLAAPARPVASAASVANGADEGWSMRLLHVGSAAFDRVLHDMGALLRVTRIDRPEAMLLTPEQSWFLRENLKLRLLNARLALLSRQFDTLQGDLRESQGAIDRYFDRDNRRVNVMSDLLRQVGLQARQMAVPRPDETLAAIAAAQAGR